MKRKNTIDVNTLEDYTLDQIDQMNKGDEYYDVCMNDSGYVMNIYGTYSDIKVESWDAALTSLYNIKSIMGLDNPFEELQVTAAYVDEAGYIFKFDQMYKGIRVIDCGVTVSADKNGTVDYLGSSYFPVSKDIYINSQITREEAGKKAEQAGYGKFIPDGEESEDGKLYIFDDNGNGRLVWFLYCTKDEWWDQYIVLVDAKTGEIVYADEAFISCW